MISVLGSQVGGRRLNYSGGDRVVIRLSRVFGNAIARVKSMPGLGLLEWAVLWLQHSII